MRSIGTFSDVDECLTSGSCAHGGTCSNTNGGFSCNCVGTGYSGDTCQTGEKNIIIFFKYFFGLNCFVDEYITMLVQQDTPLYYNDIDNFINDLENSNISDFDNISNNRINHVKLFNHCTSYINY